MCLCVSVCLICIYTMVHIHIHRAIAVPSLLLPHLEHLSPKVIIAVENWEIMCNTIHFESNINQQVDITYVCYCTKRTQTNSSLTYYHLYTDFFSHVIWFFGFCFVYFVFSRVLRVTSKLADCTSLGSIVLLFPPIFSSYTSLWLQLKPLMLI